MAQAGAATIFEAAQDGDLAQVKAFLQSGEPLSKLDENHSGLLHYAAMSGSVRAGELIDFLVLSGLSVRATNNDGFTPLHSCAVGGISPNAARLIGYGAPVMARDNQQHTPLNCAAINENIDVARVLLANGADVNDHNSNNWTPLRCAEFKKHERMAEYLKLNGAKE